MVEAMYDNFDRKKPVKILLHSLLPVTPYQPIIIHSLAIARRSLDFAAMIAAKFYYRVPTVSVWWQSLCINLDVTNVYFSRVFPINFQG